MKPIEDMSIAAHDLELNPTHDEFVPQRDWRRSWYARWCLPLAIIAVAGALRLAVLDADPPSTLSQDFLSDESWWAHNARNHALFGRWRLDDFNQGLFAAPLHTVLERLSFAAGGVHLRQARLVSALAGLATVLLIGLIMKREVGTRGSLVAMGILATDYFTVSYDRAAFVEPLPTAFMSLSLALATWPRGGRIWFVLAGVAADLACFSKINSVFFLTTPLIWTMIQPRQQDSPKSRLGNAMALLCGMAVPLMIFGATFVLPNLTEYLSQNGRLREESKVQGVMALLNVFTFTIQGDGKGLTFSGVLTQALLPTTLGLLWFLHTLTQAARHGFRAMIRSLTNAERIALLWIFAFAPYFLMQDNNQDRRYYVFVAPLTMLGAHLFGIRRKEHIEIHTSDLRSQRALIVLMACFLTAGVYLRVPLATLLDQIFRNIPIGADPGLSKIAVSFLATALLASIALPGFWFLLRRLPRARLTTMTVALAIALTGGTFQIVRFAQVITSLTYTLDQASHQFVSSLDAGSRVIDGHPLVLESKCRNLIILDRRGNGYPYYGMSYLDQFQPTHLLITTTTTLDQAEFGQRLHKLFGDRYDIVPDSLASFESWPDAQGKMRMIFTLGKIVPSGQQLAAH